MNYARIKELDIADGAGCRTSLFVSGCTHRCRDCFNPETWDFSYGEVFDEAAQARVLQAMEMPYNAGLSVLGGEPFEISNQHALLPFLSRVRKTFSEKSIWMWSGYTWEELRDPDNSRCRCEATDPILQLIDILVDGEFVAEKKNLALRFRGSENQRVLDVPESLRQNRPVISHFSYRD